MSLIGYACINVSLKDTKFRTCRLKNADNKKIKKIAQENLNTLIKILEYNCINGIRMFRISSDIVPFASHPDNNFNWKKELKKEFSSIKKIIDADFLRVSMHPGQYTVLNSPNQKVVNNAVKDLIYHCKFLDSVTSNETHKVIIHIGGVYGDKPAAINRFIKHWEKLPHFIKKRVVIENDEKNFSISDVLNISKKTGIPVVFDNLHHSLNNPESISITESITACADTWLKKDGIQKIHFSQQNFLKHSGAHSETIYPADFFKFYKSLPSIKPDIMLEVKDKNISVEKINNLLNGNRKVLEEEWGKYKYSVMKRSYSAYKSISALMRLNNVNMQIIMNNIQEALDKPIHLKSFLNAAEHVWGHLKNKTILSEKKQFIVLKEKYLVEPNIKISKELLSYLKNLTQKYNNSYLLKSYYFSL